MKAYIEQIDEQCQIDVQKNRFPYCIVWTPLPLITALFPFIGHTGICASDGVIHDFSGSYSVTVDDMAFGNPTKYLELQVENKAKWNECIGIGDERFREEEHNLCTNNCHSHVAYVLNQAGYKGGGWNMVYVAIAFVFKGKYTSFTGFLKTYAGFFVIFSIIMIVSFIRSY